MLTVLVSGARAATIAVPAEEPTISSALERAVAGDLIEVAAGTFYEPWLVVSRSVTIRGAGAGSTVVRPLNTRLLEVSSGGELFLESIEVDGGSSSVLVWGPLTATGVVFSNLQPDEDNGEARLVVSRTTATLVDVTFVGGGAAIQADQSTLVLDGVLVDGALAPSADLVDLKGGDLVVEDLTVVGSTVATLLTASDATSIVARRVLAACNTFDGAPLDLSAGSVDLGPAMIAGNELVWGFAPNPIVVVNADDAVLRHLILEGAGAGTGVSHSGAKLELSSSVLLGLDAAAWTSGTLYGGYDLFQDVWSGIPAELATGSAIADPLLMPLGTACDLWVPGLASPAIDAGDPAEVDRNGTASDIGPTGGPDSFVVDIDFDGFTLDIDCDDYDPEISPDAAEVAYDGIDQDCDGLDLDDLDQDGFGFAEDCDDADDQRSPGREEVPYDGVDQDCDGSDLDDLDQDGFGLAEDCDDADDQRSPGQEEVPDDGVDQDCDGSDLEDFDQDGFGVPDDCADHDPAVHPGAAEDLGPTDRDCDGHPDPATRFVPKGCATAPAGSATSWSWVGLFVLSARRRRR